MPSIGLDIGTSAAKALLVADDGRVLARAARGYVLSHPEPGAAELDADALIDAAFAVIAEVARTAPGAARALGISCQGEAVVPVAADGRCLAPLMVSSDTRPQTVLPGILAELPAESIYQRTGHTPAALFTLAKLRWLARYRAGAFAAATSFHCVEDLIHRRLGIEPAMGWPLAGRTLLYDLQAEAWDAELCAIAGVRPEQLARPLPAGAVAGRLSAATSARLGLAPSCLVVCGGHDQGCAALGAGAVQPGQAVYGCGTVECITPTFATPKLSEGLRHANLCTYPAAVPGRWASVAYSLSGGNVLAWYRELCGADFSDLCAAFRPGPSSVLALPYLTASGTPWFDARTPGTLVGLRLDTTRGDIAQALAEGVAYEMRLNLALLGEAGLAVDSLRATGGGTRDARLCQLKADALGRPLELLAEPEAGCLGMAAAGHAAVVGAPAAEVAAGWARVTGRIEPRAQHAAAHAERFAEYRELYRVMSAFTRRERTCPSG